MQAHVYVSCAEEPPWASPELALPLLPPASISPANRCGCLWGTPGIAVTSLLLLPLQYIEAISNKQGELENYVSDGYKTALTEERRRFCFLVEKQCAVAKSAITYHAKVRRGCYVSGELAAAGSRLRWCKLWAVQSPAVKSCRCWEGRDAAMLQEGMLEAAMGSSWPGGFWGTDTPVGALLLSAFS